MEGVWRGRVGGWGGGYAGEPDGVLTSLSSLFLRLSRPENTPLPSLLGVRGRGDDEPLWTGVSGERVGGSQLASGDPCAIGG